jgi:phenolic acid decarboxylase
MGKSRFSLILLVLFPLFGLSQVEKKDSLLGNFTPEYDEIIQYYKQLADSFPNSRLLEMGKTDIGKPLHLFVINSESFSSIEELKNSGKVFLLINNGIHPGEPDGINASILFAREILNEKKSDFLLNCVIGIIPVYNVDGCLNRGKYSRANQDGPEEYGFRGNARNLDLNRDFIKMDSENAKSFAKIFHAFNPHLLIDTHVSNGADYQYTMTFITSQICKLDVNLKQLAIDKIEPALHKHMKKVKFEMSPYVNTIGEKPESGIADFLETPRFATGYASMFDVLGFTTETHMLKPFPQRVQATLEFFRGMKSVIIENKVEILKSKREAEKNTSKLGGRFGYNYSLDTTSFQLIDFKGYEGVYQKSDVTGLDRLYYDQTKPFTKKIKYYRQYKSEITTVKPFCYIIPQAWKEVVERLELNDVELYQVKTDTTLDAYVYFIEEFETTKKPYEGHYLHSKIKNSTRKLNMKVYRGDYIVFTGKNTDKYVVETLEPNSMDSFFAWNFFDEILQQKEWFSDYVFEDIAFQLLNENADLKNKFEEKKKTDPKFSEDAFAQLLFIYNESKYKEKTHNLYPVYRIESDLSPEAVIIKKISWR